MTLRIRRSLRGCLLLVLLFGMIGANGKCDLAMRIWADLQQQIDDNREQIDSQQQQIDQLTETVCGLSVLTGSPTHPVFCAPEKQDGDGGGASGGGCPDPCQCGCDVSAGVCNDCGCGDNCP